MYIYMYVHKCIYIYMYIYTHASVFHKRQTFMKMLRFRVSELLPDIRDMQSGAKCRSESISDIHFGADCVKEYVFSKCSAMGETWFLRPLALEPRSYTDIPYYYEGGNCMDCLLICLFIADSPAPFPSD